MPIYAYKCDSCGFAKDVLQRMSDSTLTQCPSCSAQTYRKQLTAAGFQLKGSGWYATDFKGGNNNAAPAKSDETAGESSGGKADSGAEAAPAAKTETKPVSKSDSTSAETPAAKKNESTPAAGSGS